MVIMGSWKGCGRRERQFVQGKKVGKNPGSQIGLRLGAEGQGL